MNFIIYNLAPLISSFLPIGFLVAFWFVPKKEQAFCSSCRLLSVRWHDYLYRGLGQYAAHVRALSGGDFLVLRGLCKEKAHARHHIVLRSFCAKLSDRLLPGLSGYE